MTYLLNNRFLTQFPGPFDVRRGADGVDDTLEIYCLTTDRMLAATYFWETEQERRQEALAIATALNYMLHEDLLLEEGLSALGQLLAEHQGPYHIVRDSCEGRGGFWEVASRSSDSGIIQCYGRFADYNNLVIAIVVRTALTRTEMFLPHERASKQRDDVELIAF